MRARDEGIVANEPRFAVRKSLSVCQLHCSAFLFGGKAGLQEERVESCKARVPKFGLLLQRDILKDLRSPARIHCEYLLSKTEFSFVEL